MLSEYEGMPHEFPLLMGRLPQAGHYFEKCAKACKGFLEADGRRGERSRRVVIKMPDCIEVDKGNVQDIEGLGFEEVRRRMKKRNRERKVWTGPKVGGSAKI